MSFSVGVEEKKKEESFFSIFFSFRRRAFFFFFLFHLFCFSRHPFNNPFSFRFFCACFFRFFFSFVSFRRTHLCNSFFGARKD